MLHFHPGWAHSGGTVLDALAADGRYRSQWLTGTSNGGLTAHPGGPRWLWESKLFEGGYDDGDPAARPVYGAWNRRDDIYGAAPRFGSAYLRLRPEVLERATFCWPDSVYDPQAVGGPERLAELCQLADAGLLHPAQLPAAAADLPLDDPLNDYVETHPGYRATADDIDEAYRGVAPIALARELGGEVTPALLGAAQRSGRHDSQAVKWLWHCLARFGRVPA